MKDTDIDRTKERDKRKHRRMKSPMKRQGGKNLEAEAINGGKGISNERKQKLGQTEKGLQKEQEEHQFKRKAAVCI